MILHGDCRHILPTLEADSVDSVVTDPPYELGFMGKRWDASGVAYDVAMWGEVLRVLKPGGFLLAFGGPRTYHRLTCAVEDAGFQIRDSIAAWLFGSGFPKGKGQLKPAWEPIIVARRPAPAPVLQIDACRVEATDKAKFPVGYSKATGVAFAQDDYSKTWTCAEDRNPGGRWPPNVAFAHHPDCADPEPCHPDCWIAELDRQSGITTSAMAKGEHYQRTSNTALEFNGKAITRPGINQHGDTGGASRFFPRFRYQAKASTRERNQGVDGGNYHPTVKPLDLMRWLVRLVTPPGGAVLDPFAGSGSTLAAATLEGFDHIGIEADADYLPIIHARVRWANTQQAALPLEAS